MSKEIEFNPDAKILHLVLKKKWFDIGSHDALFEAGLHMRRKHGKN